MENLFNSRNYKHDDKAIEELDLIIKNAGFTYRDFELVKGDIKTMAPD